MIDDVAKPDPLADVPRAVLGPSASGWVHGQDIAAPVVAPRPAVADINTRVTGVKAEGAFVRLETTAGNFMLSRADAIRRVYACSQFCPGSVTQDMLEATILAAHEARKNQYGKGYSSKNLEMMRAAVRDRQHAARKEL